MQRCKRPRVAGCVLAIVALILLHNVRVWAQGSMGGNGKCCTPGIIVPPLTGQANGCMLQHGFCYNSGKCSGKDSGSVSAGMCRDSIPADVCNSPQTRAYHVPMFNTYCASSGLVNASISKLALRPFLYQTIVVEVSVRDVLVLGAVGELGQTDVGSMVPARARRRPFL